MASLVSPFGGVRAAAQPPLHADVFESGPAGIDDTGVDPITPPLSGAISAIAAHQPTDGGRPKIYIGSVNGGVWTATPDITVDHPRNPVWTPTMDHLASMSIGALALDRLDGSGNTVVAGFGHLTSHLPDDRPGGPLLGVAQTTNGGVTWKVLPSAGLRGHNVTSAWEEGQDIIVGTAEFPIVGHGDGLFESTDGGATFTLLSGAPGTGLPNASVTSVVGDNFGRVYVGTVATNGDVDVYRRIAAGDQWEHLRRVTNTADALALVRIAVTPDPNTAGQTIVYVGLEQGGKFTSLLRNTDLGFTIGQWQRMDAPVAITLGQHKLALAADPVVPSVVYVGGAERPLFRCNSLAGRGAQCEAIQGAPGDPEAHPDSRALVFAGDVLLYGNDGGIYRLLNPHQFGAAPDYYSLNGNLRITEEYSCAYDSVNAVPFCGTQDNGTVMPPTPSSQAWNMILGGDGGRVDTAGVLTPCSNSSLCTTRYYSRGWLQDFTRDACGPNFDCVPPTVMGLNIDTGGTLDCPVTDDPSAPPCAEPLVAENAPVAANRFSDIRVAFGASHVYESFDGGDNLKTVRGFTGLATDLVYGGRFHGSNSADLLYATGTDGVFRRLPGDAKLTPTAYSVASFGQPNAITVDPDRARTIWVVTRTGRVVRSLDAGDSWVDLTGDLVPGGPGAGELRDVAFVPGESANIVIVGGDDGVYMSDANKWGQWYKLDGALPNVVSFSLTYNVGSEILVIGTLGRGTWLMFRVRSMLLPPVVSVAKSPVTGEDHDQVTLRGRLTDGNTGAGISGRRLNLTMGSQSCHGTTDDTGRASCPITIDQNVGSHPLTARFNGGPRDDGNADYAAAYDTGTFSVTPEVVKVTAVGPSQGAQNSTVSVTAKLVDAEDGTPVGHKQLDFAITFPSNDGHVSPDTCRGTTDANGVATCPIVIHQPPGNGYFLVATFTPTGPNYAPANGATAFTILSETTVA